MLKKPIGLKYWEHFKSNEDLAIKRSILIDKYISIMKKCRDDIKEIDRELEEIDNEAEKRG